MAKIILLVICIVVVYLGSSASSSIECDYKTVSSYYVKDAYYCHVKNDPNITTQESAAITSISGAHQNEKSNSDVEAFYAEFKIINFFPRGLEIFFENLKMIRFQSIYLKEIHQADLKPFPKLVELDLYFNEIEVLEEGLFDFNPDLEYIAFLTNKIVHIEPNVFDHLNKLSTLWLTRNKCINRSVVISIPKVKNLIQAAKSKCVNSEFSSLKEKLESLEKDSKTLNSEEFGEKFATFEETFKASKFANFRPLNYKFEALKNLTIGN